MAWAVAKMVKVGEKAPDFVLQGVYQDRVSKYSLSEYRGKWVVLFFYPKDFTFICPTEVTGFNQRAQELREIDAQILGVSVDPVDVHKSWARELGGVAYPLLSDVGGNVSRKYNALDEADGVALRATFIIDPDGLVQYVVVSHMNVGRSIDETFRVVKALQTKRLCPADWEPGQETLDPSLKY